MTGTLADIAERAQEARIRPPAVTVVGPVAALAGSALRWFERAPLHGKRVAVTRARAQASGLAADLQRLGAEVVEVPSIRIEPRIDSGRRCAMPSTRWAAASTTCCA